MSCLGYLGWHFQDVIFGNKYYKDFFQERRIIIAIALLIIFAIMLYVLIGKEINSYGPEQF